MSTTIYDSFINSNVAPYSADAIGVFNSNGELVKKIPIDGFKPSYTDRLFRFGILSDVHNNNADSQSNEDIADLTNALSVLNSIESVNMTCICGDITQGGRPAQFAVYRDTVAANSPNTPVYTTTGNHDCPSSGGLASTDWEPYTGNPMTFEVIKEIGGKKVPFLFLGMNLYSLGDAGTPYLDADMDWLEAKLEEYRNERVFVITHLFFPTKAGNFKQIYPSTNWLGGSQLERLQAMNERYLKNNKDAQDDYWKYQEEVYKWKKQQLEEENDLLEKQIELEKALGELSKVKTQKILVFKNGRFQYMSDIDAIAEAQRNVDQIRLNGYASGTKKAKAGLHLVGENGPELRVLNSGDGIIPTNLTQNLLDIARMGTEGISNAINKTKETIYSFNISNITLPHVTNSEDFLSGLKNYAYQYSYA